MQLIHLLVHVVIMKQYVLYTIAENNVAPRRVLNGWFFQNIKQQENSCC